MNSRRVSLFSFRFFLALCVLLACTGLFFFDRTIVKESDEKEYSQLMAESEALEDHLKETSYTAKQEREGVQKNFYFYKDGERLQVQILAKTAQLALNRQEQHTHIVEYMQKVKCLMQDEIYYQLPNGKKAVLQSNGRLLLHSGDKNDPASWISLDTPGIQPMQLVKYLQADQAEYHYKDDRFIANTVTITRYRLPGHDLRDIRRTDLPLMKGAAEHVEFSLKGETMDFKAHQMKATFFELEGLHL